MRKNFIGLLIFLITLFIGLNAPKEYYSSDELAQEFSTVSVYVPIEPEQNTIIAENRVPTPYKLAPCDNPNPMKQYKFSRKNNTIKIGVVNGWIACGVLPEYSVAARAVKAEGNIILDVFIDETGEITEASVRNGHLLLRQAALKAAYQSRTTPVLLGGKSMKARGILIYQFDSEHGATLPKRLPFTQSAQ